MEAQTKISSCFGSEHPLVAKYNQNLVEAYNIKPESAERTLQINQICSKNVEIAQDHYGEKSLYCVRLIYTLFTARLHETTTERANLALKMLAEMVHDKIPVKAN